MFHPKVLRVSAISLTRGTLGPAAQRSARRRLQPVVSRPVTYLPGCSSGIPLKKSTTPVSSEYSTPTTSSPSFWINCSRTSDPCRRWFAETRTLARTACRTRAPGWCASSVASNASTDGRIRSTIERRFRDWSYDGRPSSSRVARTAPHLEWPSTTTSRVPNRSAANSTLPT